MSAQLGFDWLTEARQERRQGTRGLLTDTPRSRKTDPDTSHKAADLVRRSGQLRESQALVLAAVRAWPGHTAVELAHLMDGTVCRTLPRPTHWWRLEVSRRLPELVPFHVKRGEARQCTRSGTSQTTWRPA